MSFPVSREQPATGNELQEYILSTFLTFPTIFPLFDVWVCYPLLYVCVCVKNREAKITCFQMFHSDTCPLELIMKTRLFALHVRRDRHTYITDSLMYTNIRKRFTFIRVSLKEGTYLTELLEVIHLGPRLCSMFHSKVNNQLQAWLTPIANFTACRTFLLSWLGQIYWPARCLFQLCAIKINICLWGIWMFHWQNTLTVVLIFISIYLDLFV